ncbi:hypothetical protein EST38_g11612 [Candolleomyces aberdarensis]|uniref:Uncharacterized protein n=1 Tax=Candolleomyces aberdarensis TaxID=2316362 RepID=A0A4Q2D4F1_9AGAR|nr:hypothetical protein EST38_g11612 [Candolleomyces aberdarensis]
MCTGSGCSLPPPIDMDYRGLATTIKAPIIPAWLGHNVGSSAAADSLSPDAVSCELSNLCAVAASATRHELLEAQCASLLRSIKTAQTISNPLSGIANDLDVRNMALSKEKADMRDAICTLQLSLQSERSSERQLVEALENVNDVIICTKRLASDLLDHASTFFSM